MAVNFIEEQEKTSLLLSGMVGGAGATPDERGLGAAFFKERGVSLKADLLQIDALHDILLLLNFAGS